MCRAGYFDNEEDEETKGVLLHGIKGDAHDTDAFLVDEKGQLIQSRHETHAVQHKRR